MSRRVDVGNDISSATAAPGGKRVVFEARGELFNVPVKDGYTINMTNNSGAFDQSPSWSPDGKHVAYWSDNNGEYNIYLAPSSGEEEARMLTDHKRGFGYSLHWSPDSKHLAYIDETNTVYIVNAESGSKTVVTKTSWNRGHNSRYGFTLSWSPDSKWLTYQSGQENGNDAIQVYSIDNKKNHQVTSGFYNDSDPVFSSDGQYLFYLTNRNFSPIYSDMGDGTWVYPNSTQIAALALTADVPHLMKVTNDEVDPPKDKESKDKKDKKPEDDEEKSDDEGNESEAGSSEEKKDEKEADEDLVKIDFDGLESRIMILPPEAGNIGQIYSFKGKIVYQRYPNSGSNDRSGSLIMYDLEKEEEKSVMENVQGASLTADGKSFLVRASGKFGIIDPAPQQKIKDPIPTDGLIIDLIPREEWLQVFNDAWRRHRDFFYDPAMHGLDWKAVGDQYRGLIKDARTRSDLNNIISNMVSELSAGHTYTSGGDVERAPFTSTGFLGINWTMKNGHYAIKDIIKPAAWDTEVRSPLDRSGLKVKAGDLIMAVNNHKIDPNKDPYASFTGLAGKTVKLTIADGGDMTKTNDVTVKLLSQGEEQSLRYLGWLEDNRKMVDELSDGKLGYVYMSNTGGRGQLELVRMYYGQLGKDGFIIDERFNGGGQLADRFLELITKPVVYNLHWRHGKDHTHPLKTNNGPMGMLINGWAGSGGDGLPWAFQELKAGPIVGERTLGILVGPATGHRLVDGGRITVPGARLYDNDGHWFWEGEGVSPDIEVWDDPNILMQGRDPQMERVVEEVMNMLKNHPPKMTPAPAPEIRTAKTMGSNK
jgi:tricorn protease